MVPATAYLPTFVSAALATPSPVLETALPARSAVLVAGRRANCAAHSPALESFSLLGTFSAMSLSDFVRRASFSPLTPLSTRLLTFAACPPGISQVGSSKMDQESAHFIFTSSSNDSPSASPLTGSLNKSPNPRA